MACAVFGLILVLNNQGSTMLQKNVERAKLGELVLTG